jgi:hypothetical protein
MSDEITSKSPEQVTLERLAENLEWYSARSNRNKTWFQTLKVVTILSAALIPVLSTSGIPHGSQVSAGLGVLIAVIESLQQLKQYHDNWINYRATEEALKHERYLYLARAGPYRGVDGPQTLLAERVEAIVSQEEKGWVSTQTSAEQSRPAS